MRKITLSAIQFDIKLGDLKGNLERASTLIEKAARRGSEIMVLPEMWTLGFDYDAMSKLPPSYLKDTLDLLSDLAVKSRSYIISGTLPEGSEDRVYNTAFVIDPAGEVVGKYRKVHLFDGMGEKDFFAAGWQEGFCETHLAKLGIAVCYDIRFPELFRQNALHGAEIIFVPAQFPSPRQEHWEVLLRARAIENQLFVVGCNRVGKMKSIEFFGNSMIVGPYGEIIEEAGEGEEVLTEVIDLEKLYEIRKVLPSITERRPDVYGTPTSAGSEFAPPRQNIKPFMKDKHSLSFKDTIQPMKPRK
jgi:omega-amidase